MELRNGGAVDAVSLCEFWSAHAMSMGVREWSIRGVLYNRSSSERTKQLWARDRRRAECKRECFARTTFIRKWSNTDACSPV